MKVGIRRPSLRKRIVARTSVKREGWHSLRVKAPQGYGWFYRHPKAENVILPYIQTIPLNQRLIHSLSYFDKLLFSLVPELLLNMLLQLLANNYLMGVDMKKKLEIEKVLTLEIHLDFKK